METETVGRHANIPVLLVILLVLGIVFCAAVPTIRSALSAPVEPDSYLVLDLASGASETVTDVPKGGWSKTDKTDRIVLRLIEAGTFLMGTASDPESLIVDDGPQHRVTLSRNSYMGVFEVTWGQWRQTLGTNDESVVGSQRGDMPVDTATRARAERFLQALERRFPAYAFTLPTEAEWEYACRANGVSSAIDPWEKTNAKGAAHPVGRRRPNGWGLYDVCGNVWEWCLDCEHPYGQDPVRDPLHAARPGTSPLFAARGGSWRNAPEICTPTHRAFFDAEIDIIPIGLRVLCRPK